MKVPRSDGRILHVDFEAVTDTLIVARNAGVILDYGTRARILDNFAYQGRRCAYIACLEAGQEAQLRLIPAWNAPLARDGAVLEFVFRPVVEEGVDLTGWPVVRCLSRGDRENAPAPVALELRARGKATEGTYDVEVVSGKAIVAAGISGLPQGAWTRFILHRCEGQVELYAGPPGEERQVGRYPDLDPEGELYCILLGNQGDPWARGSGYWDAVRLGWPRQTTVAPPERRTVHVGEEIPAPPEIVPLGREKHLLIDDWEVAESRNLQRLFHRPRKCPDNPLMVPEHPWEGEALYLFGGVERQSDGLFRMWYWAADPTPENPENSHTCLATSADGIHWEKPILGLHECRGSRENNIAILEAGPYSLIVDPDDPRPAFRYKAHLRHGGTVAWTSPDGLHWTCQGVILPQSLDATSLHLDPVERRYIASVKIGYKGRRYRGYAESEDFLCWTDTYPMMDVDELDEPGDQLYAMKIFRYESLYLGLAKIYHVMRDDTCDIHLAVSHNGRHWERPFRLPRPPKFAALEQTRDLPPDDPHAQPFLPTGPAGSWEYGNHDTASTPPLRVGDELWFYYSGRPRSHNGHLPAGAEWSGPAGAIGLATLRVDGFVSASAGASSGWLLTRPLRLEGVQLCLNADAADGEVVVELLDEEGRLLVRSQPVRQDGVRIPCGWEGTEDLSVWNGRAIRLRFHLSRASLYAFWCE